MRLQAIRDRVEILVERNISDPLFLVSAREVIDDLEGRDYRVTEIREVELSLDGSSDYLLPLGVNRDSVLDIWYVSETEDRKKLRDIQGIFPKGDSVPKWYTFAEDMRLRLDTLILAGTLLISYRPYVKELDMQDEISYP